MIDRIRSDLPGMPDEIALNWLLPFVQRAGWPPRQDNEWRFILGKPRDLEYLRKLKWERRQLIITPALFEPKDFSRIVGMVEAHIFNETNLYSAMSDSKARISRCREYLKENGSFPIPIILEATRQSGRFHILDGHHRLCAFFYLYGHIRVDDPEVPCLKVGETQDAWVGTESAERGG